MRRLVSGMAHELRNPMQAISVNLEVLKSQVGRDAPELWTELERFARAIEINVRLLDRRLELLVAAAGRGPDEKLATLDLVRWLSDVAAALRWDRSPPRLVVEAAGDERGVRARPGALVVLLEEVLSAAREATGEEVRVTVTWDSAGAALQVPLRVAAPSDWRSLARAAGGTAEAGAPSAPASLVLRFPGA